jgi:catalase
MTTTPKDPRTTASGRPVADPPHAWTAGARGPRWVQDGPRFAAHAHGHRERLPARVVHATGAGACGTVTITNALPPSAKAQVFPHVGT